jgi:hypothetical protein
MITDRVLQTNERAVVHEGRLQRHVAQRRRAEGVAVHRVSADLREAEILIRARTVVHHVAESREDLGNAGHVLPEITEHLVRLAGHGVAIDAARPSEEQHRSLFLR